MTDLRYMRPGLDFARGTPSRPGNVGPVAWVVFADNGNCRIWFANHADAEKYAQAHADDAGFKLTPLYAAPPAAAGREEIAAYLLALEDTDADTLPSSSLIEQQRHMVVRFKDEAHEGDCTKVAGTCGRCLVDDYLRHADAILALGSAVTPQDCGVITPQLWGRFVNHYWDSLEGDKDIVLLHVKAVLDYHAANSTPPAPGADRAAVIEECAKFVEQHQEAINETSKGSERYLAPRKVGNLMGTAYVDGLRSLAPKGAA